MMPPTRVPNIVNTTTNVSATDHFETKLFKLQDSFQTAAGRHMAELRTERMRRFVDDLLEEV